MIEHPKATPKKCKVGCLVPLGLYLSVLVVGYFVTRPPLITEDFSAPTSNAFSVAIVELSPNGVSYSTRKLQTVLDRNPALPPLHFLLPEQNITIDVGDIHHASVLEEHADWQLIEFNYSNTYMATSIYRAYDDRIEPVSYQMISSVGDAMAAMAITILAALLYVVARVVCYFLNRRQSPM